MASIHCPTCLETFDSDRSPSRPFCGERCRLIDLGGWLDERFSVPYDRDPDEECEFEAESDLG